VQWQIVAKDPEAVTRFYGSLFDWKVQTNNALGYREVDTQNQRGIHGGVWPSPPEGHNLVQLFVEVDDLAAHVAKASKLVLRSSFRHPSCRTATRSQSFSIPRDSRSGCTGRGNRSLLRRSAGFQPCVDRTPAASALQRAPPFPI
jgi:hypothetical protein